MTISRRTFVKETSAAATAASLVAPGTGPALRRGPPAQQGDPSLKLLSMLGLDAARSAGASYADIRIVDVRRQSVRARNQRVTGLSDDESLGFGIRVLANGAWGFAASPIIERDEVVQVARAAGKATRGFAFRRNHRTRTGSIPANCCQSRGHVILWPGSHRGLASARPRHPITL